MAPPTRSTTDPVAALKHLRCDVLGEKADEGRLLTAFKELEIENVTDLMYLSEADFKTPAAKLSLVLIRKLLKAQEWYRTHPDKQGIPTWFELTPDIVH